APAVLLGPEARGVGAPHLVRAVGADGPAVRRVSSLVLAPHRGQEAVLPHDAKHPVLAHAEALLPKMGPHLPVPLRVEGAVLQHGPDLLEEQLVREGRLGPPPGGHFPERRACHPPDRAGRGPRLALARRGASASSGRPSFFRSSTDPLFPRTSSACSSRVAVSPSLARWRPRSLPSGSPPRFWSPASPRARKAPRRSSSTC